MQRTIDLRDDHGHQVARVGFVRHASGERHQNLARVVLGAEEALVKPALRVVAIAQADAEQHEADQIEQRPAAHDHRQRQVALLHQRPGQGDHRQQHQHRERAAREGVLQAAPQHGARAEHVPHRHRIRQAEGGEQDNGLQQRLEQPRQFHRPAGQAEEQGDARLERVGEHRRHAGEHHDLDPAPLVGIGIGAVPSNALDHDQEVGAQAEGEAGIEGPRAFRDPREGR